GKTSSAPLTPPAGSSTASSLKLSAEASTHPQIPQTSLVALSDGMRAARVTLYHVNAWGVAEDQQRLSGYSAYFKGVQRPNQVEMGNLALQALAYQSGGRTFDANNDTAGEIATCVAEATSF